MSIARIGGRSPAGSQPTDSKKDSTHTHLAIALGLTSGLLLCGVAVGGVLYTRHRRGGGAIGGESGIALGMPAAMGQVLPHVAVLVRPDKGFNKV